MISILNTFSCGKDSLRLNIHCDIASVWEVKAETKPMLYMKANT